MTSRPRWARCSALAALAATVGSCTDIAAPVVLGPPTNITVTMLNATSVRVSWTPPAQPNLVVGYYIFRDGSRIGESSAAFYVDAGLLEGITYRYRVSAYGEAGLASEQSAESPAATVTAPDVTPPSVTATDPAASAAGVPLAAAVSATFSEPLDPSTVNATTFLVTTAAGTAVTGTVTYVASSRTAEFRASSALHNAATIVATLTTGLIGVSRRSGHPTSFHQLSSRRRRSPGLWTQQSAA